VGGEGFEPPTFSV